MGKVVARQSISTGLRRSVLERDGFTCVYCGFAPARLGWFNEGNWRARESLHIDHIYPVSKGGTNDSDNLVTSCGPCNLSKRDREWRVPVARCMGCDVLYRNPEPEAVTSYYAGAIYQCSSCREADNLAQRRVDDLWEETGDFDDIALEVASWDIVIEAAGF